MRVGTLDVMVLFVGLVKFLVLLFFVFFILCIITM
jgi:hypothetical protein